MQFGRRHGARALRHRPDPAARLFALAPWGWYVGNVRYPNGAVGCVSRNYPDRRWRIACDERQGDYTYRTRDAAARAEQVLALSQYTDQRIADEMDRAAATRAAIEAERNASALSAA